jgi:probable phosphoglycerate mutase
MATTFLFIRHGHHELLGKRFVARSPGVNLSERGRQQAQELARRLESAGIGAIYSSPMERARQTAAPLAEALGLDVRIAEELNEIDIGDWTNLTMEEIGREPGWRDWNAFRSCTLPPGGELMLEAQRRVVRLLWDLRRRHDGQTVALFSHGDIIRGAMAHFLGVHLDLFLRIEIDPASVSAVEVGDWGPRVLRMNCPG